MYTDHFILFGSTHILTLVSLGLLTYFGMRKLQDYSPDRIAEHWHSFFAIIALLNGIIWRYLLIEIHDFHPGYDLPFHVCSISTYLLAIYFWFPSQRLFDVLFYWILTGSTLGILIPDLEQPFPHIRFFAMFVSHAVLLFFMLYLVIVQHRRPSENGHRLAFGILAIYAFGIAVPLNLLSHGNYLFTAQPPDMNFVLIKLLPPWPWYIPLLLGFFYLAFHGIHRFLATWDSQYHHESAKHTNY